MLYFNQRQLNKLITFFINYSFSDICKNNWRSTQTNNKKKSEDANESNKFYKMKLFAQKNKIEEIKNNNNKQLQWIQNQV